MLLLSMAITSHHVKLFAKTGIWKASAIVDGRS